MFHHKNRVLNINHRNVSFIKIPNIKTKKDSYDISNGDHTVVEKFKIALP